MNQCLLWRKETLFLKNVLGRKKLKPHFLLLFFSLCISVLSFAQQRITGTVTADGQPVLGATVQVKGTATTTLTVADGSFAINAAPTAVLVISYVGYVEQEVSVANRTSVTVNLLPAEQQIGEVVVVGYGTQKKATLAGSVSQISGTEVTKSPSANVTASLQGRLPGLVATQRNGQPGRDDANLLIRGAQTLGSSDPLVVIDGVVGRGGLSRLNPEDIETISVLKDASAAIYGARGANGVIMVTTKSGAKGKANFNFSYNYALSTPTKTPEMLDAPTFAEVYNEGAYYRTRRNANEIGNPAYWNNPQFTEAAIQKYRDGSDPILFPNTDWLGEVLKSHAYQQKMNLSVNGGNEKVRYLLSFGSLSQNGNFRYDPTFYRQYNARVKVDIELVKNLTVGANINATFANRTYSPVGTGTNFVNILQANPTLVARYPNGLVAPGRLNENPLAMDQRGYDKSFDRPLQSTFTASYKVPFVKGLRFDGSFNYDMGNNFQKIWATPYYLYEYNPNNGEYVYKPGTVSSASLTNNYSRSENILYNLRATYEKIINQDHRISAMIGFEQQQITNTNASVGRRNYLSPALDIINVGSPNTADWSTGGSASNNAYDNYLGRLNYDFRSKYILEFLFRYDGSPNFPDGKRYGFFPGIMGAWRISEEDFFRNLAPFVNQLKLKASYGELGNDRIAGFQYLQFFTFGGNYTFGNSVNQGLNTGTLPNPNVTWERAKKMDFGLEAMLWNGKLGVDVTVWNQKRRDILVNRNLGIPATMGFPSLPPENFAKVNTHGYEIQLTHRSKIGKDISYGLTGNFAYAQSKIIEQDEVPPVWAYQAITGQPLGSGLYYKSDGIYNTFEELNSGPRHPNSRVGDIKIVDINKDGVINGFDTYRAPYNVNPKYVFGLNSDFQYKGFDLNIFFQGQTGVYNYDGTAASLGNTDFSNATVWRATDRWTESNPNGTMPRSDMFQPGNTDFFFFDATFIRLKTIELGYNLPTALVQKTRALKNIRVFASAFNLATWAKEIKWADPELNGGFLAWPQQRVINFGATIKF